MSAMPVQTSGRATGVWAGWAVKLQGLVGHVAAPELTDARTSALVDSCASLGLVKKCWELRTSVAEKDEASAPQAACRQAFRCESPAGRRAGSQACAPAGTTVSLLLR